jgi:hypothetical protein
VVCRLPLARAPSLEMFYAGYSSLLLLLLVLLVPRWRATRGVFFARWASARRFVQSCPRCLCSTNSPLIELPQGSKADAGKGCYMAVGLYLVTFMLSYSCMNKTWCALIGLSITSFAWGNYYDYSRPVNFAIGVFGPNMPM